jgi:nitrogen fixation/metabolism regulation signal transduction histidine kinase
MEQYKRKLFSFKHTSKFHFRYMGLWVLVSVSLVVLANVLLFLLVEEHWRELYTLDTQFQDQYMAQRQMMGMALGFEALLFSIAMVVLAKSTAHRIAGPYIKLKQVFNSVREGNLNQELHFRKYDHLEELEEAFNGMMAELRAQVRKDSANDCQPTCPPDAE